MLLFWLQLLSLQGQPLVSVKSLSVILLQDHSGHVTMAEEDRYVVPIGL